MADIKFIDLKHLHTVMKHISAHKLVFWLGAGIDSNSPTSLPLGNGLTDHILKLACGENMVSILQAWEKNRQLITSVDQMGMQLPNRPRLETIIETVREFEQHQINKVSILEGLRAFSATYLEPNQEHYVLASYLHQGANIVTTNYGDFICKAYKDMYGANTIFHDKDEIHTYRIENEWNSHIYHIHGISEDLETIGANLATVKKSLPEHFKSRFKYWLDHNYYIVFMGYSGLDSLDVNPFIESLSERKDSTGIYVRHSYGDDVETATDKEEILLHPFDEKVICPCITGKFFEILSSYEDKSDFVKYDSSKDWRNIFNRLASTYNEDYSSTLMLGICYRLGLSIASIFPRGWFECTNKCENVDQWYKSYYSFQSAIMLQDRRKVKKLSKILGREDNRLMSIDYYTARGKTRKVIESLEPTIELRDKISNLIHKDEAVSWDISTQLNRYTEVFVFKLLSFPFCMKKNIRRANNNEIILNLKKCYELILNGGYDAVVDINQINTAHRSLALCQTMCGDNLDEAVKNCNIALLKYADVSSINGIAMTMLYQSVIWLIYYNTDKNKALLIKARECLIAAHKMIFECGLLRYTKRYCVIKFLYIYFIILSKFSIA